MPVYKIRGPDGKLYRYRVDAKDVDPDDVLKSFNQQFAIRSALAAYEPPKEKAGFFGSFKEAVTSLGLTDEAAAYAANPTEENRKAFLKAAESKYKSVGGFGKGENWEAFKELLGGSLGALAAPILGGVAGAAAGPLGAIGGFTGTSAAQYSISNLQRQAEAQQAAAEAGEAVPDLQLGKAAVASAAQAGLDVIPGALILKGLGKFPIAQRLLAQDETSSKAANVLIDAFKNKNLSLKGNVVKGVGLGVAFEVPQEIAQQALERWQAGLSLTDSEAKEEFKQAAIGAAILGGGFGAIGGAATYRGEQARRAAEEAAARREEEFVPPPPPITPEEPVTTEEPVVPEETEDQLEARLEREAIQAYEREREDAARLEAAAVDTRTAEEMGVSTEEPITRDRYDERTLREAAEAEALAPRDEEGVPYVPPAEPAAVVTPRPVEEPVSTEVEDVSGAAIATPETDIGAVGGGADLFTLGPPAGELGAAPTGPEGLGVTGDVTERTVGREEGAPPALTEPEGEVTTLAEDYKFGQQAPETRAFNLRERAINFIRETGRGSAPALQKALDISLSEARVLRDALLGSGTVVQKTNVKGAKSGSNYFVVEGDFQPTAPATREVVEPEVDQEQAAVIEEARQRAARRQRGEGVVSDIEAAQIEADKAAEAVAPKPKVTAARVPEGTLAEETRRAFADLEAEQAAAQQRPEAATQQGLDLVGGKGRAVLSDVEKKILDDIKSAARYLVQSGQMSVDQVDKFNQELRKPAPDLRKLRRMVDQVSAKEEAFETEEQGVLDRDDFVISENFADTVDDSSVLTGEGEVPAGKPLDFNERKPYFRNRALNRFKKRKSQVKGMPLDTVRGLVNRIVAGWKNPPNIIVVQSYLDLPPEVDPESNADSMGVAYGNDVYIIANNIRLVSDLKAVVFHESLGHYGLEQLFGTRLLQTMLDIYRTNKRVQADADAWLAENPDVYPESEFTADERNALAAEEVLAELSEAGPIADSQYRAAFNRVAALIRKFARALSRLVGRDLSYSNREVADILVQAHSKVISGKTRLVPRYNNIRYMKSRYNKVLTDALRNVQDRAPPASQEILTNTINALDNVPASLRNAKFATYSMHHMMQLYERYAPAIRRLNILVERMAKDVTDALMGHETKTFNYREKLRAHPKAVQAFNDVANFINVSQAPVLEEQLDSKGNFVKFVPSVAAQRLRGMATDSAAYNALSPQDKVLHKGVNDFYALPPDLQQVIADVYTDYRKYSDEAFKVKLDQFLSVLPPETVAAIRKKYQDNRLKFYLPLRREGTYKLSYRNADGVRESKLYVSEAERNLGIEEARRDGATEIKEEMVGDRSYEGVRAPTGLLKELSDSVEAALTAANVSRNTIDETKQILFDSFVDFMPGTSGNDLRQEINSRVTWTMNGATFYGRLGYIEDVLGVYEKAVPRLIYQINNLKYTMPLEKVRDKIKEQLAEYNANKERDPKFRRLPDLPADYVEDIRGDLEKRIRFAKNPIYSNYVYTLSKANYIYSIALNISSALINTTIIPMMAWPSLAAKYGIVDASRAVGQAMAMFFRNSYTDPKTGQLRFNLQPTFGNGATGEFVQLHRILEMRSVVGTAAEQELQQAQNVNVPGYEGLSAKVNLAMSYVFRSSERFNREVTALATYMLARNIDANGQTLNPSRGQASVGKATEEAIRLNYDVNGASTPETNSRLYQNDIGRIILTFRTHALNMILNLAFTFNQALEKINANEPDATQRKLVRAVARRKLLYIFGSTYMLAGIKGLPLFGAAEVLASLLMGDDDEPYDLEQEVLDSVGTLGLNGPVNELLNIDIASRTGFYGLLWRDDPKRLAEVGIPVYVLERIAGPTYGLVEAARRGFNDLADGELVRASEALTPAPIRNAIKGMRYGIEGAQTRDGLPIVEDVSLYNSAMQVLGFAPADLATAQAQRGATYQVSEKIKNRRTALLTNLYTARKAGNSEAIAKAMDDIRNYNAANPAYAIKGSTIIKSFKERERRAREAIMGIYQPRDLRMATSEYVADLDAEDENAFF